MKVYEVVKDHKSGLTKVMVREERHPSDPLSRENIRRHGLERRARVASIKSWWVALRFAWRDREQRTKIVGHGLFFAAMLVFPVAYAVLAALGSMLRWESSTTRDFLHGLGIVLAAVGALALVLAVPLAARKLFRRKS